MPDLATALDAYRAAHPEEAAAIDLFLAFLRSSAYVFERRHEVGHFTGSAWLVSADGQRALLMHHRKLDRWLQPGGHADGDRDLARVALREAAEETGLADLCVEPAILDVDRHRIPARGMEPAHWHYDVRYVVRAGGSEAFSRNEESLDMTWREVRSLAVDTEAEGSVRRMARKWLARSGRRSA
ncbi:NUDIX hydrolase [Coralloluteibacterium stylophorae]|uniref:NUDIX hydrolase n=1 Tax=Coralloluteibacterium stylophorae TaxID=1776034 RepID=A0A8J8AZR5_9GAMM|nr:NUDIX hydrolase [Coralloluteibacterium stylophorae]MBS7455873.1 NUDIX hydrolase [Coralloluteibacterium stylophorae]